MAFTSKVSKMVSRPKFILLGVVLLALASSISGNPVPDQETSQKFNEAVNETANQAKDFVDRAKNTFTGKATNE